MKKIIWSHTVVYNEENFIWFALMSVVDHVDKMLVWDTGSMDNTVKIIEEVKRIKGDKIEFRQVGETTPEQFTLMRQKMLDESKCDWILILDGDEVWWEDSIKALISKIQTEGDRVEGIAVQMILPVGDIYHIQEEKAGEYGIAGRKGHLSLRAINKKIPGLHVDWPYGKESYFDKDGKLIQDRKSVIFLDVPYLHVTHLIRSTVTGKGGKFKYEIGDMASKDFKYPEVLYQSYPNIVYSPWRKISGLDLVKARLLTPVRKIKRRLING